MSDYETPEIMELGDVEAVTQGRHFSRPDGSSGTTGNRGNGKGGVSKP
jgi:hypothetical protein